MAYKYPIIIWAMDASSFPDANLNMGGWKGGGKFANITIFYKSGVTTPMTITHRFDGRLGLGDKIVCNAGAALFMFPSSNRRSHWLGNELMPKFMFDPEFNPHAKTLNPVLELNEETISREVTGKVSVVDDIGNITRITGASTR